MNCKSNSNNNLSVVQGDTLGISLTLDNPEGLVIEHVHFVCKSLNIDEEFIPSDEDSLWALDIDANIKLISVLRNPYRAHYL